MENYTRTRCYGCLSTDRLLFPIDDYIDIYIKIMEIQETDFLSKEIPNMCWECRAVLRNVVTFKKRSTIAHKYLTNRAKKVQSFKVLSNLSYVYNNQYTTIIHDDDKESKEHKYEEQNTLIDVKIEELSDGQYDNDDTMDEQLETHVKSEFEVDFKEKSNVHIVKDIDNQIQGPTLLSIPSNNIKNKTQKPAVYKYKIVHDIDKDLSYRDSIHKIAIDESERLRWVELKKNAKNYKSMPFRCERCVTAYPHEKDCRRHMEKFHANFNYIFECDICTRTFQHKSRLKDHVTDHYTKYRCNICNTEAYKLSKMKSHLNMHHKRAVLCSLCGLKFVKLIEFHRHYKDMHARFVCDYCEKSYSKQPRLIQHIYHRHSQHICKTCKRSYSSKDALKRHNDLNHVVSSTEQCYCVECDIQFENSNRYKTHLKTSVKHNAVVGVPCPECNKVYQKRCTMNNHYKYVHLKETNYFCDKCDRYFLNGFRLRQHTASIHDKIPRAKNKICPHCGRGFSTNRILTNHIRTHTGERPFTCDVCQSTFTQKTALIVHKRAIHKDKE